VNTSSANNHPDRSSIFMMFKEQLGETYGVMVYQEDVIKIVLHYAGFPLRRDILRRMAPFESSFTKK
jgi:DNA polymerase-3 subunit alpha/error-prone DNA polymerase